MNSRFQPQGSPIPVLDTSDFDGLFRAVKKLAKWRGLEPAQILAMAPAAWAQKADHGGGRKGAGRPANSWYALTSSHSDREGGPIEGHHLPELPLRLVVEKALQPSLSEAQLFHRLIADRNPDMSQDEITKRWKAYQHAVIKPAAAEVRAAADRKALRRQTRLAA